jgi:allantoin racemase
MRLLVINPNSDTVMSGVIRDELERVRRPDTEVDVVNAAGAPIAIESALDEALCTPGTLELVRSAKERGMDAVVIACFSDPALEAARELTRVPVVGIQESALHLAAQLGEKVAILSTGFGTGSGRLGEVLRGKLGHQYASCRRLGLSVSDTVRDRDLVMQRLVETGRRAQEEDGAQVFVLGCAGLGDLAPRLAEALGTPVIDPNAAALKTAEVLVELRLTHAKPTTHAAGREPVGAAPG